MNLFFNTNKIAPRPNYIKIGKHCWVSNYAIIMGGSKIPDYSIVSSLSQINKDWSECDNGTLFSGVPAAPKKTGLCRVDNLNLKIKYGNIIKNMEKQTFRSLIMFHSTIFSL